MDDDDGTKGEHRRGYEQQRKGTLAIDTICLSVCLSFCLPHAGYGGGTTARRMVATSTGREDNTEEVRWLYYPSVVVVVLLLSLCCLPHAGRTTTRKMVVTTTAREDNMYITEESTLAILPVCCLFLLLSFCCLPHAGYGGGTTKRWMVVTTIKGTRGQHCRRTYVGYTTCLLFWVFF